MTNDAQYSTLGSSSLAHLFGSTTEQSPSAEKKTLLQDKKRPISRFSSKPWAVHVRVCDDSNERISHSAFNNTKALNLHHSSLRQIYSAKSSNLIPKVPTHV